MSNIGVNEEDGVLVSPKAQAELQSLGKLYDKYAAPIYGIIIRIVNDETLAEDVLTKVFLNAHSEGAASNSATNGLFEGLFKTARQMAFHALNQEQLQNLSDQKGVYEGKHTAFDLLYYKGLNYNEAAVALNKSVDEVKAEVRVAIKNLKTKEML